MAPCPGNGIGQVLFYMGNAEISMQLAGRYYCGDAVGGGVGREGVVAVEIRVVAVRIVRLHF